jgi:tetratricopeptide (TPR) repeat protein
MISIKRKTCCGLLVLQLAGCSSSPTTQPDTMATAEQDADSQPLVASLNPYLVNQQAVPKRAQADFDQAVEAMRIKSWRQAEASLLRLSADYPQLSGPWLNLGITYLADDRLEDAEAAFRRAIAVNGNNLDAYNHLAALRRSAGDFAEAEALYQQALAIWPQHAATNLNLGVLYDLYMGKLENAASYYQAYQDLQLEPDRRVAGWLADMQRRTLVDTQSKVEQ